MERAELPDRAGAWIDLVSAAAPSHAVRNLYVGEYWQAGLELARAAASRGPVNVSVLSAGLGLVHSDDIVPAYAATFTRDHPDSVCTGHKAAPAAIRRQWWDALACWQGPGRHRASRRLVDLARIPGARLLVCAGPDYLDAAADDLRAAHKVLGDDRVVIVAAGHPLEGLSEVWVRCPGQLRMRLGGSMASTGVRAARAVVESLDRQEELHAQRASEIIAALLQVTQPLPRFERDRLADTEIVGWITADAAAHPGSPNKSAALRRLREQGRACEQGRFSRLYDVAGPGR